MHDLLQGSVAASASVLPTAQEFLEDVRLTTVLYLASTLCLEDAPSMSECSIPETDLTVGAVMSQLPALPAAVYT